MRRGETIHFKDSVHTILGFKVSLSQIFKKVFKSLSKMVNVFEILQNRKRSLKIVNDLTERSVTFSKNRQISSQSSYHLSLQRL